MMKKLLPTTRSSYIFALAILAIGIGLLSKKVIIFRTECSTINKQI